MTLKIHPMSNDHSTHLRKPPWLKQPLGVCTVSKKMRQALHNGHISTICEQASCPNLGHCWSKGHAAFLILGTQCTRNCHFCDVSHCTKKNWHDLPVPDPEEPARIARSVQVLGLKRVVITSVTRDDLICGGARQFARVIRKIRQYRKDVQVEILTPDFYKKPTALSLLLLDPPDIFNHNIEMPRRLYPSMRSGFAPWRADYDRSLKLLAKAKTIFGDRIQTKSSFMLGLGETDAEIRQLMQDLRDISVDHLVIGQYLQPSPHHAKVKSYVSPEKFLFWQKVAKQMGFLGVVSSPFARSSSIEADFTTKEMSSRTPEITG